METLYDDFIWEMIYKILKTESHVDTIDKDTQNFDIDEKVVYNILDKNYMDAKYLELLKSMFLNILHHTTSKEFNIKYLTSLKLASLKNTSEGYALLSNFKSIHDMVIVKTARDADDNRDILYEYFIGTIGINTIRSLTPNFAYTLALFQCNPLPIKNNKIDLKKFCNDDKDSKDSKDSRNYVIYEKIVGESMHDFIKKATTSNDIYKIQTYILQLVFALIIAQKEIGFVHYDLHTDNIILRKLLSPKIIEYEIYGKTYKIETDVIPTIIDYGFSHFVYQGIPFGGKTMPDLGILPTMTPIGFDLFKVVMYIMITCFNNQKVFNEISWIMDYFKDDQFGIYNAYKTKNIVNLGTAFDIGWASFYDISNEKSPNLYNKDPRDFLEWVSKVNKPFWNKAVHTSESIYNIPSNTLVNSYNAKIEGKKIFNSKISNSKISNSKIIDNINDCKIETEYKSYIINQYIINEFGKILFWYKNNIKDSIKLENTINILLSKNQKNSIQYKKNDDELLSIYLKQLLSVQSMIDLDGLNDKLDNVIEIVNLKRLSHIMSILTSYIKTYENYRLFIEYSKSSFGIDIDIDINSYYIRVVSIFKKYEKMKTEYIFESLRNKLQIIYECYGYHFIVPLKPFIKDISILKDAINNINYVIDDIRLYYPLCEYSINLLEKKIYKIILSFSYNKITTLYIPSRSNVQFQMVSNCDKDFLKYIIERRYKPRDSTYDISLFIDAINSNKMNDNDVYKYLDTNFKKNKIQPLIYNDIKFVIESKEFTNLIGNIKYLDIGSSIMKQFSNDVLDILGGSKVDLSIIDLIGTRSKNFFNQEKQIEINKNGKLPFSDDYFSIITSFMVLHNLSDIKYSLSEIFRVLKKRGIFIVREYNCDSDCKKIISNIDGYITDKELLGFSMDVTPVITTPYNTSSEEWKSIMKNIGFIFKGENNGRLTSYMMFTK